MLLQKYGSTNVYGEASIHSNSSKLWRTLLPHFQTLIETSHWQIGKGDISFWCSNRIGEILKASFDEEVTVKQGLDNIKNFAHILTYEQLDRIRLVELDPTEDDKLIFSQNGSGKFSTATYLEACRVARPEVAWATMIWNRFTPYRVKALMWQVFHDALPVDINIQRKGINLASKCVCCHSPSQETLHHLLIHSELATNVRSFFVDITHKSPHIQSIAHFCTS